MKIKCHVLSGLCVGFAALAVSSCGYDPYYSTSSYSSGYGSGYGSSNFSTSVFVSTGHPRWGYDPYARCYYDYTRRSYYDPYLCGYYPAGYRPRYVYGAPHPHGWSRGRGYCPPPTRIRSHTITNCDNRAESYRELGRDWSENVRVNAPNNHEPQRPGGRDQNGWRGEGNHSGEVESQSPGIPFFNRDGNDQGQSGRGDAEGGGVGRDNEEQPSAPQLDVPRDELPQSPAQIFEAPQQIEMPAPSQQAPDPPQQAPDPQAPGEDSGGIISLGEG